MKKQILIVTLFLMAVAVIPAQNLEQANGYDWQTWSDLERQTYVKAFVSGMFVPYAFFADRGFNDAAKVLGKRLPWDITIGQLISEITLFYHTTGALEAQLALVLFRRNEIWGPSDPSLQVPKPREKSSNSPTTL